MNVHPARRLAVLAASLALALPLACSAAVDAFLKVDGIKGESTDDKHKEEIDIESWSVGGKVDLGSNAGGARAGKPCVSDLLLVKQVDKASPLLFQALVVGNHIANATLAVRKAGEKPQDYLVLTLKEVQVSSVQHSSGGDLPMESVALNFASMEMTYKPIGRDGTAGAPVKATVNGGCTAPR